MGVLDWFTGLRLKVRWLCCKEAPYTEVVFAWAYALKKGDEKVWRRLLRKNTHCPTCNKSVQVDRAATRQNLSCPYCNTTWARLTDT